MDCRWNYIVRRLAEVHVVIGMYLLPVKLGCSVSHNLIHIHVCRGARTSLVDINDELVIPLALCNFGCRHRHRLGDLLI